MGLIVLSNFVNINGFSQNVHRQIQTNEALKSALELYKLDSIDWFSLSPSKLILLTLCMSMLGQYQTNRMNDFKERILDARRQQQQQKQAPPQAPPQAPQEEIPTTEKLENEVEDKLLILNKKFKDI